MMIKWTAMHCPNCGTVSPNDQKFCRACGLSLEKFSQLLAEQLPTTKTSLENQRSSKLEKAAFGLWTGAAAIFFGAICWGIISEIIIRKGEVLGGVLFLTVLTAISLGALLITYSSHLEKRAASRQLDKPEAMPKADTAPDLLSGIGPAPMTSVTDHTTELIENDEAKNSRRRQRNQSKA
jgi:hypothetical protein